MFIDGKLTRGEAFEAIAVLNPATEEILGEVPAGGAAEVGLAVAAAGRAFGEWRRGTQWSPSPPS